MVAGQNSKKVYHKYSTKKLKEHQDLKLVRMEFDYPPVEKKIEREPIRVYRSMDGHEALIIGKEIRNKQNVIAFKGYRNIGVFYTVAQAYRALLEEMSVPIYRTKGV